MDEPELLLEIRRHGGFLRVAAFDPERLDEVVVIAPAGTGRSSILRLVHGKLAHMRERAARSLSVARPAAFL